MGGNASPLLADLCLSMMEFNFIMQNPTQGRQLRHTMRYIDDILTLNTESMTTEGSRIYDNSLPLTFDDTSDGTGHFLDLQIDRNADSFSLYDKRKDFNFQVIRYTQATSNCPNSIGLNTITAQLIRLGRICTETNDFTAHAIELLNTFTTKGYEHAKIAAAFEKFGQKDPAMLRKLSLQTKKKKRAWLRHNFLPQ